MATYTIQKFDCKTNKWENFGGGYTSEEVKQIIKGFPFDGHYYSRKNGNTFYLVEEE